MYLDTVSLAITHTHLICVVGYQYNTITGRRTLGGPKRKPSIYVITSSKWPSFKCLTNKKFSYRRETARQLPTWRGAKPSSPLPIRPLWLHLCVWSNPKPASTSSVPSVKRTLSWIGHSRSFNVILICAGITGRNPERVYCRNVPLMPTLFLKLTKIWQREHNRFVDFNDPI